MRLELEVNGEARSLEVEPMARLLDMLRQRLGLPGTKEGCGEGECGACTVMLDGEPVLSCLVPMVQCRGRSIETVEAVAAGPARAMVERLVDTGGVQCGACTPGIVLAAWALVRERPRPSRAEVKEALAGNLCRCTGYEGIFRALVGDGEEGEPVGGETGDESTGAREAAGGGAEQPAAGAPAEAG